MSGKGRLWANQTVGFNKDMKEERIRKLDGYNSPAVAVRALLDAEDIPKRVWEPANGNHRISRVLEKRGHRVFTSDIHRWDKRTMIKRSFQSFTRMPPKTTAIITNPPFRIAAEFVETAMRLLPKGGKLCLLLRLQFLEGRKRKMMFTENPPRRVLVFSYRLPRMHIFGHKGKKSTSTLAFCWLVWEAGYKGPTELRWL